MGSMDAFGRTARQCDLHVALRNLEESHRDVPSQVDVPWSQTLDPRPAKPLLKARSSAHPHRNTAAFG